MLHILCLIALVAYGTPAFAGPYVGSQKCAECHEQQYASFQSQSKKAKSWHSVTIMAPKLTPQELESCYECHTTGYKQGGFKDYASTPHLAGVGCETCHGPGAAHAESGSPEHIKRKPDPAQCQTCHNASRVTTFNFKPLVYSGGH